MERDQLLNVRLAALGIIALILLLLFGSMFGLFAVSGYGGISSRINNVEHEFTDHPYVDVVQTEVTHTMIPGSFGAVGSTGIKLELGQPQYTGDDIRYQNEIEQETDAGVWVRNWEVRIAYFDLSWTISSTGGGALAISGVTYWIELNENQFDVFTAADDVEAYILEVVTIEKVDINDPANVKVSPTAQGYNFDLVSMETKPIPGWMSDAGYQGVLSEFKHVKFSFTVDALQPTQILHLRYENGATWKCQVRALVFGFWEVLSPYDEWEYDFPGWLDWLDDIFAGLEIIVGLAVGIVLSIVILKFVPDKRLALMILIVTWAVVVYGFGFLELFT